MHHISWCLRTHSCDLSDAIIEYEGAKKDLDQVRNQLKTDRRIAEKYEIGRKEAGRKVMEMLTVAANSRRYRCLLWRLPQK